MNLRERFEKLHPVPSSTFWNQRAANYSTVGDDLIGVAYRHLWQGFQAGHAAGLEAAAKFLDEWNTAIGDDLAKSIRAMKGPK